MGKPKTPKYKTNLDPSSPASPKFSEKAKNQSSKKKEFDLNSLAEQSESIKRLWVKMAEETVDKNVHPDPEKVIQLPIPVILDFLVNEGVCLDRDKARAVIAKQIGEEKLKETYFSCDDFNKLFCKGMFKKALIKIAQIFEQQVQSGKICEGLSLARKLDTYKRQTIIEGLDPRSEKHKDTQNMLHSLRDIIEQANPDWMKTRLTYLEFLKNPWQKKNSDDE